MSPLVDKSPVLTHFIRPEYLITLLKTRAFHLVRLDCQSDPADGKLPPVTFEEPHQGTLERNLGASAEFLKSQARAIEGGRNRTFIMSWTLDPSPHMRTAYGEDGRRCAIRISEIELKILLGYEWTPEVELPPKRRPVSEIPGAYANVQLIEATYTDDSSAVPVVPSYSALGHKHEDFAGEAEIRVHAFIGPDTVEPDPGVRVITWGLCNFQGLSIAMGARVANADAAVIEQLAIGAGVPVCRDQARPPSHPPRSL